MRSTRTGKTYERIQVQLIDTYGYMLKSASGVSYQELADSTWMSQDDEFRGTARYKGCCTHGGGIHLIPVYERIGSDWFSIYTGKPAPSAAPREERTYPV